MKYQTSKSKKTPMFFSNRSARRKFAIRLWYMYAGTHFKELEMFYKQKSLFSLWEREVKISLSKFTTCKSISNQGFQWFWDIHGFLKWKVRDVRDVTHDFCVHFIMLLILKANCKIIQESPFLSPFLVSWCQLFHVFKQSLKCKGVGPASVNA